MKVLVFGFHRKNVMAMRRELKRHGIAETPRKPDIVMSLGGDGTFLSSERKFPGIPKVIVKDSDICRKCDKHAYDDMLNHLKNKEYAVEKHQKLEARVNSQKASHICVNDFTIRNKDPTYAIRFSVHINKEKRYDDLIGDGIVVATPFGSTAYFYSITKMSFTWGIGVAFNNITKKARHLVIDEKDKITFRLNREKAVLAMDNHERLINLKPGDTVTIRSSKEHASIIKLE